MEPTSAETVLEPEELQETGDEGQEPAPAEEPASEPEASLPQPGIDAEPGAGEQLSDEELVQSVVALVFASPEPLSERRLVQLLEGPRLERVRAALATARARLSAAGLPLELRAIAGGHQLLSKPELGPLVQRLFKAHKPERISAAALETLAVIAYRQPVTKAEIEAIRGVQAGPILRTLVDRGLARVEGRADVPGHPLQYATTRSFLDRFGLGSLEELPRDSELSRD
jgi:segregation and condensation protein B